jgi:hypothetical protein
MQSRLLIIDSKDREVGSSSSTDFKYTLRGLGVLNCIRYKVTKVVVPNLFYQIPSQSFFVRIAETTTTIDFPEGNYTASEMATVIVGLINSETIINDAVVTFDQKLQKFTFSSASTQFGFRFNIDEYADDRNIGVALGLICLEPGVSEYNFPDGSQANSFSSPFTANLSPWKKLFIECGSLDNGTSAYFNKTRQSIIQSVPINSNRGQQIIWEDQTNQYHAYNDRFSEHFKVRLLNDWNEVVDIDCKNWAFEVFMEVR